MGYLDVEANSAIEYLPSASLSKTISEDLSAVALIPTSDIITNKELYVSAKIGISFDGSPSNSYIYYEKDESTIDKLLLSGDASTMEVIFGKILFKEMYNVIVEIVLTTDKKKLKNNNFIVAGDDNFFGAKYKNGISFAEEMIEMISAPFVNYVLASQDKDKLIEVSENILAKISGSEINNISFPDEFPLDSREFIKNNIPKVFYMLDEDDIEGINNLINLPFYHGMIKDIIEVKFV